MTFERKIAVRVKLAAGQGEKEEGEEDRTSTKRGPRAMQCGSKQNKGTPHGAKAAEVYGIVGYLLSLISFGPAPNSIPRLRSRGCLAATRPGSCMHLRVRLRVRVRCWLTASSACAQSYGSCGRIHPTGFWRAWV